MERLKIFFLWILTIVPVLIVFRNFFDFSNSLVWGDAPFFYPENLKELFNPPFSWDIRNNNFGGSQTSILWLYVPTFLMGVLNQLFNLNHEISIRAIFYFPLLIFSLTGNLVFFKKLGLSDLAKTFGILFYLLNSYILVVIDGGQIGIALSYGLFPWVFYTLLNFIDRKSLSRYLITTGAHFLIFNTDLRVALILILFEILWVSIFNFQNLKRNIFQILTMYLIVILLSSFWVVPFISNMYGDIVGPSLTKTSFIKLINSFYLFQPHFPNNDFGNLNKTPIYYIFFPFIFFLGIILGGKKKLILLLSILYLLFVFLAKGGNPPFGEVYKFFTGHILFGSAFRDSSKFYIPSILIGSLLICFSVDLIKEKFQRFKFLWIGLVYIFLILSINPAFLGKLNGVLGKPQEKYQFDEIHNLINEEKDFRTLWFGEKPSLGFADWKHPSLAANLLYKEHPFASMIDGEYDLYYFLHNKDISKWYELLGIKYIFYPPNLREKSLTLKEKSERVFFENFISNIPELDKVNLPVSFPVYQTKNPSPKIFAQEKILIVTGGDEIYERLFKLNNFSLKKNAVVFLESCKFDAEAIFALNPDSFGLITAQDKTDLYLSFFCKYFFPVTDSKVKEWAVNNTSQYLNWKAQLLERGVKNYDYDFDKGLAYSTNKGEKLKFDLKVNEDQNYYLPIRYLTASQSSGLRVNFSGDERTLRNKNFNKLEWELAGPFRLKKGNYKLELTNLGGLTVVNTFGLIPQSLFEDKREEIDEKFKNINVFYGKDYDNNLNKFLNSNVSSALYWQENPVKYQVKIPSGANWLIFSERFDSNWKLQSYSYKKDPLPFYSIINGYYIGDIPYGYLDTIYYQAQGSVSWGLYLSVLTFFLVCFASSLHIILKGKLYGSYKKYFRNIKD